MNKEELTLLVADDHPMLLKGLVDTLTEAQYCVIQGVSNGAEAVASICKQHPTIALLDIEMPLLSGFEVIKKCREAQVNTKFIILTSHKEKGFVHQAKKLAISGYLLKDEPFEEIERCIDAVAKGKTYFSTTFDEIFAREVNPHLEKIKFLSPSERTIVRLIAQENSSKEISELLSISTRTVEKHRANIIAKLDLESGTDSLTHWSLEHRELILSL